MVSTTLPEKEEEFSEAPPFSTFFSGGGTGEGLSVTAKAGTADKIIVEIITAGIVYPKNRFIFLLPMRGDLIQAVVGRIMI
jgi:hypothetical protein